MRVLCLVAAFLLAPLAVFAQSDLPTSHEFLVYAPGASAPQVVTPIPLSIVTCGLTLTVPTPAAVNPNRVSWTDPADNTKKCQVDLSAPAPGPIIALPSGNYEAAMRSLNAEGTGADSNRDPFARRRVPSALTGVKLLRVAP